MKYKLVVADFDDTTVGHDLIIHGDTKKAIYDYVEKGGTFIFCTGRMTESIIQYARELGLKGEVIGYQGAEIADIDTGYVHNSTRISQEIAVVACKYLEENGWYFQVYDGGVFLVEKVTEYAKRYENFARVKMVEVNQKLSEFINNNNIEPLKIMLFLDKNITDDILKHLKDKFKNILTVNRSKATLIELVSKDIDKGKAVELYVKRNGFLKEQVICIGDGLSDMPMIEYAGLGVAMGNAEQSVKDVADFIAPTCDELGLAYVIKKFCLDDN